MNQNVWARFCGGMTITKEQSRLMTAAAEPLVAWLKENCHPHCEIRLTSETIELFEGLARNHTNKPNAHLRSEPTEP